jgi:hypothetical protein
MPEMLKLPEEVDAYYKGDQLEVPYMEGRNGVVHEGKRSLWLPARWNDISENSIRGKLEEIDKTHRIIVCGDGSYAFEIAIVNANATGRTRLFCATARSGITRNPNNAYELALRGLADENCRIVYVGSGKSGFGPEGNLSESERRYLMKSGSLIERDSGEPRPFPLVKALQEGLTGAGVEDPEEAYSESAGRALSDALCVAFRGIRKVRRNAALGVVDLSRIELARRYADEGRRLAQNEANSPDLHKVNRRTEQLALESMPRVYGTDTPRARARGIASEAQIWAATRALSRGPTKGDPLLEDALAVAHTNPAVQFIYVAPELDLIAGGEFQRKRWDDIAARVSAIGGAAICIYHPEWATHGWHGAYPAIDQALDKVA